MIQQTYTDAETTLSDTADVIPREARYRTKWRHSDTNVADFVECDETLTYLGRVGSAAEA